jgi:hypothetical protein
MSQLNGRLSKLEKQIEPEKRIIVLWPGDELPEELKDNEDLIIIRIVYGDGGGRNDEP